MRNHDPIRHASVVGIGLGTLAGVAFAAILLATTLVGPPRLHRSSCAIAAVDDTNEGDQIFLRVMQAGSIPLREIFPGDWSIACTVPATVPSATLEAKIGRGFVQTMCPGEDTVWLLALADDHGSSLQVPFFAFVAEPESWELDCREIGPSTRLRDGYPKLLIR